MGSYPWMSAFLAGTRQTVAPSRGGKDAALPPRLVALTVVTGLAADGPLAGASGAHAARRTISVAITALTWARNSRTHRYQAP